MRHLTAIAFTLASLTLTSLAAAQTLPDPIKSVQIGPNRELLVNDKPFFPIMGWLQGPANLPKLKSVGINTIAGYWRPAPGQKGATAGAPEYADIARKNGLYFACAFDPAYMDEMKQLKGSDVLLAWTHMDEPDLPRNKSDAEITPGKTLIINTSRPLYLMFDGDVKSNSSAILDPMADASFTIKLKAPVTATALAIANVASGTYATEVAFEADGKELLKTTLKKENTLQKFDLPAPATFQSLTVKVTSVEKGSAKYGAIAEIEALSADGKNLLLSPVQKVPQMSPEEVAARYAAIKAFDTSRPVFLTVSDFFIKGMEPFWPRADADKMYPLMVKQTDVVGFDLYPLYGWNNPKLFTDVSAGMDQLNAYGAKGKPTYQWIECLNGNFGTNTIPVTPVEIRNEVWQAIIHGATGIGYFSHQFQPTFSEFGVPEENQKAILAINTQLTRLTPALLAPDAVAQPTISLESDPAAQCLAKNQGATLYILAQTIAFKGTGGDAVISLANLKAGTSIEVLDENRTLTAEAGKFTDHFDRLAVHLYKLKP